jgi:iron complex transport system substrate-binding protein
MRLRAGVVCTVVIALLAGAGAPAASGEGSVTIVDAGGRTVSITNTSRIVSIGGDITEILYALGMADRIVAVDTTSTFPAEAMKEKSSVGYMRALSSEGVLSTAPSLILASERAGPPEVVQTLKSASVTYLEIPEHYTPAGVADKIRLVGKALGAERRAEETAHKLETKFEALAKDRAAIKRRVRALFLLSVQNGRVVAGGRETSADAILQLAGAENVASGVHGFRPLTDESIVELAPEAIVAMRRAGPQAEHGMERVFDIKAVASTPAGAAKKLIVLDGQYLLGFGPRAPAAARDLMNSLYPQLAKPPQ